MARKKQQQTALPFMDRESRAEQTPGEETPTLESLREAIAKCRACDIYKDATQPVFGDGSLDSKLVLVGEQPGDQEDKKGKPFVGPAGRLLDKTLEAVEIPREVAYVTNVVKHFKWTPRGKRRLHSKPSHYEIQACKPWLEAEVRVIDPPLLVLLGATAAQALLGSSFRVTQNRRTVIESPWARWTFATVHPASLLRIPDPAMREQAEQEFIEDFRLIAEHYQKLSI